MDYKTIWFPSYEPYYDGIDYSLSYSYDGWHTKTYDSIDKEWSVGD